MTHVARLPDRAVLEVTGEDRVGFLQGLVSNDVTTVSAGKAVWAALLTPQGKYLADFFILSDGDRLLLDAEAAQADELARRLNRFRLRSRAAVARTDWAVYAAWSGAAPPSPVQAPDPRLPDAGARILTPTPLAETAGFADWDRHRLRLGLPDGSRDLDVDRTVLLEAGFDELNGVSWTKGCYMGQELTARTKYRALLKRRLVPVAVHGPLPEARTPVTRDGVEVGTMRSGRDEAGLAVLRLDALHGALRCAGAELQPRIPGWMVLPAREDRGAVSAPSPAGSVP